VAGAPNSTNKGITNIIRWLVSCASTITSWRKRKKLKGEMKAMEERMTTTIKETKQDMQAMEERMTTTSKETQQELKQLNGAASEVKGCLETIVKLLGRED
jgi:Holliday junction resolvasome RuvABC endonuclease subunit